MFFNKIANTATDNSEGKKCSEKCKFFIEKLDVSP